MAMTNSAGMSEMAPTRPPPMTAQEKFADTAKTLAIRGAIVVVVLIVAFVAYRKFGSAKDKPTEVAAKPVEEKKAEPAEKKPEPKKIEEKPVEKKVEAPEPKKIEEKPAPVAAAPAEEKKKVADVADLLQVGGTRKAANVKLDDDDTDVKALAAKNDNTGKSGAAAPGSAAEKKPEADAASVLGLKKKEPEPDPANVKPVEAPITATEPTFVPVNMDKLEGADKTLTPQISGLYPGWRVRDINTQNSAAGASHRGKDKVIALNPLNDVLPTRLIANIEIPAKFRPRLLFEVSSKDGTHDWLLSAKVAGMQVYLKIPIKLKDPTAWQEVPVDLSSCAGKRVEVVLEALMKPKTKQDKFKEQIAYFRNIRLDWPGKPANPAP